MKRIKEFGECVNHSHRSEWKTAIEMALTSHNLSKDGMTAVTSDGKRWAWSTQCEVWARV